MLKVGIEKKIKSIRKRKKLKSTDLIHQNCDLCYKTVITS